MREPISMTFDKREGLKSTHKQPEPANTAAALEIPIARESFTSSAMSSGGMVTPLLSPDNS